MDKTELIKKIKDFKLGLELMKIRLDEIELNIKGETDLEVDFDE